MFLFMTLVACSPQGTQVTSVTYDTGANYWRCPYILPTTEDEETFGNFPIFHGSTPVDGIYTIEDAEIYWFSVFTSDVDCVDMALTGFTVQLDIEDSQNTDWYLGRAVWLIDRSTHETVMGPEFLGESGVVTFLPKIPVVPGGDGIHRLSVRFDARMGRGRLNFQVVEDGVQMLDIDGNTHHLVLPALVGDELIILN